MILQKKPEKKPAKHKKQQTNEQKKTTKKTKNHTKGLKYSQSQPTENVLNPASLVYTKVIAK